MKRIVNFVLHFELLSLNVDDVNLTAAAGPKTTLDHYLDGEREGGKGRERERERQSE